MKKKILLFLLAPFLTIFALFLAVNKPELSDAQSRQINNPETTYTLVFDKDTNVLSRDGDTTGTYYYRNAKTQSGNDVEFTTYNLASNENNWGTILEDGFIKNSTNKLIKGMKSITIDFANTISVVKIEFGFVNGDIGNYYLSNACTTMDSSEGLTQSFNFFNESPNYIQLSCDSTHTCSIESMSIEYSCVEGTKPSGYNSSYLIRYFNTTYDPTTDTETKWIVISQVSAYYHGKVTSKPADPTSIGRSFLSWNYNGEPWDFENNEVTSNIDLLAHYGVRLNYIEYSLNDDGETYTATLSANYQANIIFPSFLSLPYSYINNDSAYYKILGNGEAIDPSLIKKVVCSENCKSISDLWYFENVTTIVFTEHVEELTRRCVYNCYSLKSIIIEGDIPICNPDCLDINGYCFEDANVFVNDTVYASLTHKYLEGRKVYKIGDVIDPSLTITFEEYCLKSNEQCYEIADTLLKEYCKTELDRKMLLYPYLLLDQFDYNLSEWITVRDFALELVKDCTTDEEKAHAIYYWIQTNIDYVNGASGYSPYQAFIEKKGVCAQFTYIMHDMLSAVNIPSFYVHGMISVSTDLTVSELINIDRHSSTHAWIIAYINNEWKYYDPTTVNRVYNETYCGFDVRNRTDSYQYYVPYSIDDGISCLPEEVDYSHLESDVYPLVLREERIRGSYYGDKILNGIRLCSRRKSVTSSLIQNISSGQSKQLNNRSLEPGEIITSYIECPTDTTLLTNLGGSYSGRIFYTSSGKSLRIDSALKYIIEELSESAAREALSGTNIILDNNLNVYYLIKNELNFFATASLSSTIIIPGSYNDIPVTNILINSFAYSEFIDTLIVEEGVKTLYTTCFESSSITSIYLPASISKFVNNVFGKCAADVYMRGSLNDVEKSEDYNEGTPCCTFHENYNW